MWTANVALNILWYLQREFNYFSFDYPLDLKKNFFDGRRILGDAKTFLGLPVALFFGFLGGWVLAQPKMGILLGFFLYLGEIMSGFLKRRLGVKRGERLFFIDQTDYVITGFLGLKILNIKIEIQTLIIALFFALIAHPFACRLGYRLKIRTKPW